MNHDHKEADDIDITQISPAEISEICREYRQAANQKAQIKIISELHLMSKQTVIQILRSKGFNPPTPKPQPNGAAPATITFNGESHTISEWAQMTGISKELIRKRLEHGWNAQDILTIPPSHSNRRKHKKCSTQ